MPATRTRPRRARRRGGRGRGARSACTTSGSARSWPRSGRAARERVLDLGCGEGRLLRALLAGPAVHRDRRRRRLGPRARDRAPGGCISSALPERQRERLRLLHGALTYRDDAPGGLRRGRRSSRSSSTSTRPRCRAFERVVFEFARPATVVVTTPNAEYNVRFADLPAGRFRHRDHRFEWTRAEFGAWADRVARPLRLRASATCRSAPKTRRSARRPRWRCSSR